MPLRSRVYGAGKVLILAAALVSTYIIFAVGSMRYALRSREVQVPALTNRSTADASQIISDLGLSLKVDDVKRIDPRIPAGRVLTQEPAPGSTSRQQRTVRIWLSAGQRSTSVPAGTGESQRVFRAPLAPGGLPGAAISE